MNKKKCLMRTVIEPKLISTENYGNADEFLKNTYFVICQFHFLSKVVPDLAGDLFRLICALSCRPA